MADMLGIKVLTEFEEVADMSKKLRTKLDEVSKSTKINLNIDIGTTNLKQLENEIDKIKKSFNEKSNVNLGINFNELTSALNAVMNKLTVVDDIKNKTKTYTVDLINKNKELLTLIINQNNELTKFKTSRNYEKEAKELQKIIDIQEKYLQKTKELFERDIVPKNKLLEFEQLINLLDVDSQKADIQVIENEYKKLLELEKQLIKEKNERLKGSKDAFKEQIDSLTNIVKLEEKLKNIKSSYDKGSGVNKEGENYQKLEQEYNSILNILEEYRNKNIILTKEEQLGLLERINNLKRLSEQYKDTEKTAEKGFNFKQYRDVTNEIVKLKSAYDAYNQSLLAGHKLISANIQETENYYKITQQLQEGNYIKSIGVYWDKATGKAYEFNKSIRNNLIDTITWEKALTVALRRMVQWSVSGGLWFGTLRTVKQGLSDLISIDNALVDLKKVTNATDEEYKEFVVDINNVAQAIGHTTEAAINATTAYAKLGYSIQEAKKLAEQSLIYSNIGDINIEEANKSIISTMKAFGMEAEDVTKIIDVANEVGNNFAITTGGIGEALQRSASALKEANNSYEQSVALITAANNSIQDTAKVGTAMKSISMSLRGIDEQTGEFNPKLRETIKLISGVDIMKDENTFKSTYEIVKELSNVYDKLSDKQRALLQNLIAGKYQGNVFSGLMENAKELDKIYNTALNSAGSAAREQERYMTSISAKINQFKESVKTIWIDSINTDAVKNVVGFGTNIVKILDNVIKTFGSIPTAVGMATVGFSLFNRNVKEVTSSITKNIPVIGNWDNALIRLSNRFKEQRDALIKQRDAYLANIVVAKQAGQSTTQLEMSLNKVRGAIVATTAKQYAMATASALLEGALSMGLSVAIGALITGLAKLINWFDEAKRKTTELAQTVSGNIQQNNDNIATLQDLASEYQTLSTKTNLTVEEQRKLHDISNQIAQISPKVVQGYDAQGNAILNLKGNVSELIEELKEKNRLENLKLVTNGQDAYKVMVKEAKDAQKELDDINEKIRLNQEGGWVGKGRSRTFVEGIKQLQEELNAIPDKTSPKAQELQEKIDKLANENLNLSKSAELVKSKMLEASDGFKPYVRAILETDNAYSKLDDNSKKVIQDFVDRTDFTKFKDWDSIGITIRKLTNDLNRVDVKNVITSIEQINEQFKNNKDINAYNEAITEAIAKLAELTSIDPTILEKIFKIDTSDIDKTSNSILTLEQFQKNLQESMSEASQVIREVNQALQEHAETGKFDAETILSLAKSYPQLLAMMNNDKALEEELTRIKANKIATVQTAANGEIAILEKALQAKAKIYFAELNMIEALGKTRLQFINDKLKTATGTIGLAEAEKDLGEIYDLMKAIDNAKKTVNNMPKALGSVGIKTDKKSRSGGSSGSSSSSVEKVINDKTDIYMNRMTDINNALEKQNDLIKNLQDDIKTYLDMGDNNSLTKALKEQKDLVAEYDNKIKLLTKSQNDLNKVGSDLYNQMANKYSFIKNYTKDQLLNMSEADRQEILDHIFPSRTFTGKNASKLAEDYRNQRKQLEQWLKDDISKWQENMSKIKEALGQTDNDKVSAIKQEIEIDFKIKDNALETVKESIDEIQYKLDIATDINEKNYTDRIRLTQELINKEAEHRDKLQATINELIKQRDAVKDIPWQWDMINEKVKEYNSELQDSNRNIIDNIKSLLELSQQAIMSQAERSLYDGRTQSEYEQEVQDRIDGWQQIIDSIEKSNDLLAEQEERQKRILEIQELQAKLANAQNEKKIRLIGKKADGTFGTEFVADAEEVENLQKELQEKQKDYNEWEKETAKKHQINSYRSLIEAEQKKLEAKRRAFEQTQQVIQNAFSIENIMTNQHLSELNQNIFNGLETVKSTFGSQWDLIVQTVNSRVQAIINAYNQIVIAQQNAARGVMTTFVPSTTSPVPSGTFSGVNIANTIGKVAGIIGLGSLFRFDTGGYTANSEGLAWLDKKEIVLNAKDTENLLKSVDITRQIVSKLNLPNFDNILKGINKTGQSIQQAVHINASFPNVKDATEIEKAFNSLSMNALQHAHGRG